MDNQWERYQALCERDQEKLLENYWSYDVDYDWWDSTYDYWKEKLDEQGVTASIKGFDLDRGRNVVLEIRCVDTQQFFTANPELLEGLSWAKKAYEMDPDGAEIVFDSSSGWISFTPFGELYPDYPEGIVAVWDKKLTEDISVLDDRLTGWLKDTKWSILHNLEEEYEYLTSREHLEELIKDDILDITDDLDELENDYAEAA